MRTVAWMAEAACAGGDPDIWFPIATGNHARIQGAVDPLDEHERAAVRRRRRQQERRAA